MALGTVTLVKSGVLSRGGLRFCILDVVPSSGANYTANGETIALTNFPKFRREVLFAQATPANEASGTDRRYVVDISTPSAPKIVVIKDDAVSGVPAEEAGNANLSTLTVRIFAIGR